MRNARELAHARSKPKAKKQAKGKAGCRKLHNTRERAICVGNKWAQLSSGVAATGNAVCKEKSLSQRVQYA